MMFREKFLGVVGMSYNKGQLLANKVLKLGIFLATLSLSGCNLLPTNDAQESNTDTVKQASTKPPIPQPKKARDSLKPPAQSTELSLQGSYDNPVLGIRWVFDGHMGKTINYKSSQSSITTTEFEWSLNEAENQLTLRQTLIRVKSTYNTREQALDQTKTVRIVIKDNELVINGNRYLKE
jgi:hypothetical protein